MSFHRKHNYVIELLLEKIDFEHAFFYNMFENELTLIKKYFEKNLKKDFISANFASFNFFVKKFND